MKTNKAQTQQLSPHMKKVDRKLKKAAKMYEEQFIRQMVKAMRKSVNHSALTKPSFGEKIYQEQLDDKYVGSWVDRGGTGFGEMVYNQLVERFYPQLQKQAPKEIRPVDITDRYKGMQKAQVPEAPGRQTFNLKLGPQKESASFLSLPWKGKFEKEFELASGEKVALFSHPFDLKSTFVFKGQLKPGLLNKTLSEGENFAALSPESDSITWQIQDTNSRKGPTVR
jgi:flagellar protein FlgJ